VKQASTREYTPKEAAYEIVMGWAKIAYNEGTADVSQLGGPPSYRREVKRQLAKLHNQLLEKSGLHGILLSEEFDK
jgi:hypothetical protein